ncbi:hypothetical protein EU527_06425 [Candidatus Thorarchaeota archaeon]|nr:MAG: hypothetical protein EU527_06425 [Candidatus Thorarchaeota archaeon]
MKNASFQTLLDDVKISIRFAYKNAISYILALLGVMIISIILLVFVAILIFVPLFFAMNGLEGLTLFFESFDPISGSGMTNIAVGIMLFAIPLMAPFFVAIGALFGLGREIVESEGTSAEGVFIWYKKKFFSLAGGGIVLFLFVLGPLLVGLFVGTAIYGEFFLNYVLFSSSSISNFGPILSVLLLIWFALSLGFLTMMFPAIIDGYSVIEAVKKSVRMSITYFDRVFGVWVSFLVLLGLLVLPLMVIPYALEFSLPLMIVLGIYAIPAILFLIFIYLPAITIALTRVYMILTADDNEVISQNDEAGPSFIGGL